MDETFNAVQRIALRNTDVYLTWDHLDIYVATSMRNRWEYEEIFDFTGKLFNDTNLSQLNLRYFDPTQSKCRTSRDKGLLEGLMLKRAHCTIYMAQETDTLGKELELASTLAQGKPVIAFVPTIVPDEYAKTVDDGHSGTPNCVCSIFRRPAFWKALTALIDFRQSFLSDLEAHRSKQPFELWFYWDADTFKRKKPYWRDLCRLLAHAESRAFDKRATVLQKYHPLGMQLNLKNWRRKWRSGRKERCKVCEPPTLNLNECHRI